MLDRISFNGIDSSELIDIILSNPERGRDLRDSNLHKADLSGANLFENNQPPSK